jgi:hypothetical protein
LSLVLGGVAVGVHVVAMIILIVCHCRKVTQTGHDAA